MELWLCPNFFTKSYQKQSTKEIIKKIKYNINLYNEFAGNIKSKNFADY